MKHNLLLILLSVTFYTGMCAQNGRNNPTDIAVTELNSLISVNGGSGEIARVTSSDASTINVQRLKNLVTQVQPSIYFEDGVVNTYGDLPTNLFTDLLSIGRVDNPVIAKQNIEIATIVINSVNELNSTIDLSAFSNFPNLKYIYFKTKLNTTSANIASHIINYDNRFNIVYKIDKGDSNQ